VDAHAFEEGVDLVLGGVRFDSSRGLAGHSDGDVIAHAMIDAVLGAAGLGDIGALFPSTDSSLAGVSSLKLLDRTMDVVREEGWELVNADCILVGEEPRIAPRRDEMRAALAQAARADVRQVTVRATTTDGLGFAGRAEGLAAQAVALLRRD
jgi:2-C-methyl-D-erythritol 2,4-cyclodiphosphate synthase